MVLQRGFGIGIMNPGAGAIALFIMFAFWAGLWCHTQTDRHTHTCKHLCHVYLPSYSFDDWNFAGDGGIVCFPACPPTPLVGTNQITVFTPNLIAALYSLCKEPIRLQYFTQCAGWSSRASSTRGKVTSLPRSPSRPSWPERTRCEH